MLASYSRLNRKNFEFLKIQDGGVCHIGKSKNYYISATDLHIIWLSDVE